MSFGDSTTVNASDVTGTFGSNVTIEGSMIRTAPPPNERWEMSSANANKLLGYSGNPIEVAPGGLQLSDTGAGTLVMKHPQLYAGHQPSSLELNQVDSGGSEVVLKSQYGGRFTNPDTGVDLFTWDATGTITGPGQIASLAYGGTTDASGFLVVTHSLGWVPTGGWAMTTNPSASFAQPWGIDTFTSTTVRLRFANVASTGAAASTAVSGRLFLVHP